MIKKIKQSKMLTRLKAQGKKILSSYLRALVALLSATQMLNWGDLRGLAGILGSAFFAAVPSILQAVQVLADSLDDQAEEDGAEDEPEEEIVE